MNNSIVSSVILIIGLSLLTVALYKRHCITNNTTITSDDSQKQFKIVKLLAFGGFACVGVAAVVFFVDDVGGNSRTGKGVRHYSGNLLEGLVEENGTKKWYKDGKLHRENDLPAVVNANGDKWWYKDGELHRDNGIPAVVNANGDKAWYVLGQLHRDNDLPAVEYANGDKAWWVNGIHVDQPDSYANLLQGLVEENGTKKWYKDGKLHRDGDLPAVENANGDRWWFISGKIHRDNGLPAIEYSDGLKLWWVNGIQVDQPDSYVDENSVDDPNDAYDGGHIGDEYEPPSDDESSDDGMNAEAENVDDITDYETAIYYHVTVYPPPWMADDHMSKEATVEELLGHVYHPRVLSEYLDEHPELSLDDITVNYNTTTLLGDLLMKISLDSSVLINRDTAHNKKRSLFRLKDAIEKLKVLLSHGLSITPSFRFYDYNETDDAFDNLVWDGPTMDFINQEIQEPYSTEVLGVITSELKIRPMRKLIKKRLTKKRTLGPQPTRSTDWQEVCRHLDKQFTKEQITEMVGMLGRNKTKRQLCAMLAEDLESVKSFLTPTEFVTKNCPKDRVDSNNLGVDPVSHEDLVSIDPNDLLTIDGHCFSRDTLAGLVEHNELRNPYTQVLFTEAELKKITEFLSDDDLHSLKLRKQTTETAESHLQPTPKQQIEKKLENVPYISPKIYELDPSGVARLARYVSTESGGIATFTLGDIASANSGLKALDMFVDQMNAQEGGLWTFVRDYPPFQLGDGSEPLPPNDTT
jgi:hypothetical protein